MDSELESLTRLPLFLYFFSFDETMVTTLRSTHALRDADARLRDFIAGWTITETGVLNKKLAPRVLKTVSMSGDCSDDQDKIRDCRNAHVCITSFRPTPLSAGRKPM